MENLEVTLTPNLTPCSHSEYLIPADELEGLSELAGWLEQQTQWERSLFEQLAGGVFDRLARELMTNAIGSVTTELNRLDIQMMAALSEFKHEACQLLGATLISELGKEKRSCAEVLRSKVETTVGRFSWPNRMQLFVNPDQSEQLSNGLSHPERFDITADPNITPGNFRLKLGRTSISYDLAGDLETVAANFRKRLLKEH